MYAAAAGMAAQQARIDAASNDLANVSTTGYKPVRVAFRDLVYDATQPGTSGGVRLGTGAAATDIGRSNVQGALQTTEEPLDVAVQGPGGIAVRLPDGAKAITRDGHLRTDAENRLVTDAGLQLDPPITLPAGTAAADVKIGADGSVSVGTRRLGRLTLQQVSAPAGLQAGESNTLRATQASGGLRAAAGTTVQQGALEQSGTDVASAMTDMMGAQRAYQLTSRAIQVADQAAQIANQIKR